MLRLQGSRSCSLPPLNPMNPQVNVCCSSPACRSTDVEECAWEIKAGLTGFLSLGRREEWDNEGDVMEAGVSVKNSKMPLSVTVLTKVNPVHSHWIKGKYVKLQLCANQMPSTSSLYLLPTSIHSSINSFRLSWSCNYSFQKYIQCVV